MTSTFDQPLLSSVSNKSVSCDGYSCKKKATKQLTVTVGDLGDVSLNLCKDCLPKFSDSAPAKDGGRYHPMPNKGVYSNEYIKTNR